MSHLDSVLEAVLLPFATLHLELWCDLLEILLISSHICCLTLLLWWFWCCSSIHRHVIGQSANQLEVFVHCHPYFYHCHRLLVGLAAAIPAATSAALSASVGLKIRFAGLSETARAVLISAESPLRLQPLGSAQSRSCFLHAQSSLSMHGSSN